MTTTNHDLDLARIHWSVSAVGIVIASCAFVISGAEVALSAGLGALLSIGNLVILQKAVTRLLAGAGTPWMLVAAFKFVLLLLVTYLLLASGLISALGLALGFGALPLGIVLGTVFGTLLSKPGDAPPSGGSLDAPPRHS